MFGVDSTISYNSASMANTITFNNNMNMKVPKSPRLKFYTSNIKIQDNNVHDKCLPELLGKV